MIWMHDLLDRWFCLVGLPEGGVSLSMCSVHRWESSVGRKEVMISANWTKPGQPEPNSEAKRKRTESGTSTRFISTVPVPSLSKPWKIPVKQTPDQVRITRTEPACCCSGWEFWTYWTWSPVWPGSRWSCRSRWSRCRHIEQSASDTVCCSVWTLETEQNPGQNQSQIQPKLQIKLTAVFKRQTHLIGVHAARLIQIKLSEDSLKYNILSSGPQTRPPLEAVWVRTRTTVHYQLTSHFLILFQRIWNSSRPSRALPSFWGPVKVYLTHSQ